MKSRIFSIIKYIAVLAISFALLALAFKGISIRAIFDEMKQASVFWIFVSIVMGLISFISRGVRWKLLIESLGYTPSLKNTTSAMMVGYFANLALPRLGEVTRCGSLSKAESIPFSSLLGTVIIERIVDVLSLFVCLLLAFIVEFDLIGNFLSANIIQPIASRGHQMLRSPIILTLFFVFLLLMAFGAWYWIRKSKGNQESKVKNLLKGLLQGLQSIAKLKRPWLFIFHSAFIWFLSFLGMYVGFFMIPATTGLGLTAALFLLVISGFGMAAPVQGGIGAYHLLVSQGLMLYGLTKQDGLTFATLTHSLSLIMVVIGGIASFLLLLSFNKKKLNAEELSKQAGLE